MKNSIASIINHENKQWSEIFKKELLRSSDKKFSSFWWEDYYNELSIFINNKISENNFNSILEAGSGSGKATILLDKKYSKTLLDISPIALEYSRYLANIFKADNIKYVEGNIFSIPFDDNSFDFIWNIGVIEHYELSDIKLIIREMMRVCVKSGVVSVGVPNFYSGPILKARILKKIRFIPGYRINSEKFYKNEDIVKLFLKVAEENRKEVEYIEVKYFGNPMIMETPKFILKTVGRVVAQILERNKFITLVICKFK